MSQALSVVCGLLHLLNLILMSPSPYWPLFYPHLRYFPSLFTPASLLFVQYAMHIPTSGPLHFEYSSLDIHMGLLPF